MQWCLLGSLATDKISASHSIWQYIIYGTYLFQCGVIMCNYLHYSNTFLISSIITKRRLHDLPLGRFYWTTRLVAETVNQMPLNSDAIYVTCDYSLSPRYITFPVLNPDSISLSLYTGRVLISIKSDGRNILQKYRWFWMQLLQHIRTSQFH